MWPPFQASLCSGYKPVSCRPPPPVSLALGSACTLSTISSSTATPGAVRNALALWGRVFDLWGIVPGHMILFHYLDDFLILGGSPQELTQVTRKVVDALRRAGFLVSPKSVLEPVIRILFLGKFIDTCERKIWSHPRAFLQIFAQWIRLATAAHPHPRHRNKVLGFIQWHVRPWRGMRPFLVGAYCCQRWGADGQQIPPQGPSWIADGHYLCYGTMVNPSTATVVGCCPLPVPPPQLTP